MDIKEIEHLTRHAIDTASTAREASSLLSILRNNVDNPRHEVWDFLRDQTNYMIHTDKEASDA